MKKILLVTLITLSFISVKAQYKHIGDSLCKLKQQGKLTGDEQFYNPNGTKTLHLSTLVNSKKGSHNNSTMSSSTACNCWIPRDSSFHVVPLDGSGSSTGPGVPPNYANDDWSTNGITLPFNFCFYGAPAGNASNQLYINNNGNISFGAPYSTFSAVAFPSNQYTMVAPFWSDVDTDGPNSRYVWYKMTSTYLIIQWDSVGYYMAHDDKLNTYQLIITDGNDPILPAGNNISFCYGDMQWTTGDASGGTNGFGGTPATVGINKGDGTTYFQLSLFDNSGSTFTNPSGTPTASGVNWLDYKSFYFNSCGSGGNIAPLPTSGLSPCGQDTLKICAVGDTLLQTVSFTGPEPAQSVSVTASGGGALAGHFSVVNSTPGTTASLTFMVNSAGLTPGFYTVTVTGTDNGTPVLSTTLTYIINILNAPIPSPAITVSPAITCGTAPPLITLTNSSSYDSYTWSTGATTFTTSVAVTTTVQVTVTKNGCSKTGSVVAQIYPVPSPVVNGALNICPPSVNTVLSVNQPVMGGTAPFTYNWDAGASTTFTLTAAPGTHSVMVTDAHGCKDSVSVTVTTNTATANPVTISSAGSLCAGSIVLSSSITNATSYLWQPGGGTASTYTVSAPGTYSLSVAINGCSSSTTYTLANPVTPTLTVLGDTSICAGSSTTLTVSATPAGVYTYTWSNGATPMGNGTTQIINTTGNLYNVIGVNSSTQCKSILTFTINNYNNPTVSINGNSTMCAAVPHDLLTAVPVGANGPYTYSWSPGATVTTQTNSVTSPHTYSVVVTDSKGCKASAQFVVKLSNPSLHMLPYYICPNQSTIMHAHGSGTPPLTYVWYPGPITGSSYTTSTAGNYAVVMTDFYGCKDSVTVNVIQNPKPQANFTYSPATPEDNTPVGFSNTSTIVTPDSIAWDMWNFGDGNNDTVSSIQNPVHTYTVGGTYPVTLIVASKEGCLDTIVKNVVIQFAIIAPNIITPNGDGLNEFLAFKNLLYFKNNKIWIYNRWGTLIYQDNDYKNNWTGKDYSDGTYFYILEVPDKPKTFKGFFESLK